jgi:NADH:ubiquinone oxidoreductase subunit 3 (subunit A)
MDSWLPILVMLIVAIGFALVSLGVTYLISPKKSYTRKVSTL